MAAPSSLLANGEESVHWSRDGAAHEQQVPLGIHLHDPEAQLGEAPRTHVARHPLALDDPGRIGPRGDGAGLPVPGIAVGLGAAAEVMPMHHALEPAAFGHPGDLYAIACLEDRHGDRLDRKSTRLNSSHLVISYAVFCLKKKKKKVQMNLYACMR